MLDMYEKHHEEMEEICEHVFEKGPEDAGKDKKFIKKLAE